MEEAVAEPTRLCQHACGRANEAVAERHRSGTATPHQAVAELTPSPQGLGPCGGGKMEGRRGERERREREEGEGLERRRGESRGLGSPLPLFPSPPLRLRPCSLSLHPWPAIYYIYIISRSIHNCLYRVLYRRCGRWGRSLACRTTSCGDRRGSRTYIVMIPMIIHVDSNNNDYNSNDNIQ
jgi:hypothetical protein